MAQITLQSIRKTFTIAERPEGRFSALRGAFIRKTRIIAALDNISFEIDEGDLVGYIGPNGAGKSTTVKIMSGILTPEQGACTILGRTPWKERIAHVSQIGVVFGQRSQLWWDVPVNDSFEMLRDIYNVPYLQFAKRQKELLETLEIGPLMKTPTRQLSLGQRMRCEVAAALLHNPRILFLDEPTIGLDAVSKIALRRFLQQENRSKRTTMILTTHDMDDIEALCKKVMVIGHGRLLYNGDLATLKRLYAPLRCIRATVSNPVEEFPVEGAEEVTVDGNSWRVLFRPETTPAHTMVQQLAQRLPLRDIVIEEQNVEHMIASMYKEMRL